MPANIIKSFASRSGRSKSEVERLWDKAKAAAKKQLGVEQGDRFFQLTTGILKKMLKLETDGAVAAPSTTISTANIAPGQSGSFAPKMGKTVKRKVKTEALQLIESYGKDYIR